MQLSIKGKLHIAACGTAWLALLIWFVAFGLSALVFMSVSIILPVALVLFIGTRLEKRLHNPEAARRLGKATISFSRVQMRVGEEFGVSVSLAPPEPIRIESATLQLVFCESRAQPGTRAIPTILELGLSDRLGPVMRRISLTKAEELRARLEQAGRPCVIERSQPF